MIVSGNRSLIDHTLQKFTSVQERYDEIRLLEPLITKDLSAIVEKLGGHLDGLEFSVKTASSICDKLERMEKNGECSIEENMSKMPDIIRYTQICKHDDIFTSAKSIISTLEERGYKLKAVNNYYEKPYKTTGYKGLHMNLISPQGQIFELQIHSEKSFAAKQKGHEMYEEMRAVATPVERKEELKPIIMKIHSAVPDPPGYNELHNFRLSAEEEKAFRDTIAPVRTEIEKSNDESCLKYKISQNGKDLLDGFEMFFSDKSVLALRHFGDDKHSQSMSITNDGRCSDTETVGKVKIKMTGLKKLQNVMECVSYHWFNKDKSDPERRIVEEKAGSIKKIMKNMAAKDEFVMSLTEKQIDRALSIVSDEKAKIEITKMAGLQPEKEDDMSREEQIKLLETSHNSIQSINKKLEQTEKAYNKRAAMLSDEYDKETRTTKSLTMR